MKRRILTCLLVLGLAVGTATAQLGNGVVFDPTNYHNALLRYYQLQQHLADEQAMSAQQYSDAAWNWNSWGPWGPLGPPGFGFVYGPVGW